MTSEYDFQNLDLIDIPLYKLFFILSKSRDKILKLELYNMALCNTGSSFYNGNTFEFKMPVNFKDEHTEILTFETYQIKLCTFSKVITTLINSCTNLK